MSLRAGITKVGRATNPKQAFSQPLAVIFMKWLEKESRKKTKNKEKTRKPENQKCYFRMRCLYLSSLVFSRSLFLNESLHKK